MEGERGGAGRWKVRGEGLEMEGERGGAGNGRCEREGARKWKV